jgi:hypothetical protein
MATDFTPGPWTLVEREGCGGYRLEDIDGGHIAYLEQTQFIDEREDPEQEANCKLIAAAPDLYAALERILGECAHGAATYKIVTEALAKARGKQVQA